ncbi:hypothetical protein CCO04_02035 [Pimelobacter sp. 30-1]|nr:hypothetical protein [Pimelobacter sp. 30-1]
MPFKAVHHIGDLARDLASIPDAASEDVRTAVRKGAMSGNLVAKNRVRTTIAGPFYRTLTWDQPRAVDGVGWSADYGPVSDPPPGGAPALDAALETSGAAAIGLVTRDVRVAMDDWFRPGRGRR